MKLGRKFISSNLLWGLACLGAVRLVFDFMLKEEGERRLALVEETPSMATFGGHYLTLYVGKPSQPQRLAVSIGTDYTSFPCMGCIDCGSHHISDFFFDYSVSHVRKCPESCTLEDAQCEEGSEECIVVAKYDDMADMSGGFRGFELTDAVYPDTSGGEKHLPTYGKGFLLDFLCQTRIHGMTKHRHADGVLAMSAAKSSFINQMYHHGKVSRRMFSLCFRNFKKFQEEGRSAGSLTLGHIDESLLKSPLVWANNTAPPPSTRRRNGSGDYIVRLKRIYFGNGGGDEPLQRESQSTMSVVPIEIYDKNYMPPDDDDLVIEPNKALTRLHTSFQKAFQAAFKAITGLDYVETGFPIEPKDWDYLPTIFLQLEGHVAATSSNLLSFEVPGLVGHRDPKHPFDVLVAVPPHHYLVHHPSAEFAIPTIQFHPDDGILGSNVMQTHEVVFDLEHGRIGFAERKYCPNSLDLEVKAHGAAKRKENNNNNNDPWPFSSQPINKASETKAKQEEEQEASESSSDSEAAQDPFNVKESEDVNETIAQVEMIQIDDPRAMNDTESNDENNTIIDIDDSSTNKTTPGKFVKGIMETVSALVRHNSSKSNESEPLIIEEDNSTEKDGDIIIVESNNATLLAGSNKNTTNQTMGVANETMVSVQRTLMKGHSSAASIIDITSDEGKSKEKSSPQQWAGASVPIVSRRMAAVDSGGTIVKASESGHGLFGELDDGGASVTALKKEEEEAAHPKKSRAPPIDLRRKRAKSKTRGRSQNETVAVNGTDTESTEGGEELSASARNNDDNNNVTLGAAEAPVLLLGASPQENNDTIVAVSDAEGNENNETDTVESDEPLDTSDPEIETFTAMEPLPPDPPGGSIDPANEVQVTEVETGDTQIPTVDNAFGAPPIRLGPGTVRTAQATQHVNTSLLRMDWLHILGFTLCLLGFGVTIFFTRDTESNKREIKYEPDENEPKHYGEEAASVRPTRRRYNPGVPPGYNGIPEQDDDEEYAFVLGTAPQPMPGEQEQEQQEGDQHDEQQIAYANAFHRINHASSSDDQAFGDSGEQNDYGDDFEQVQEEGGMATTPTTTGMAPHVPGLEVASVAENGVGVAAAGTESSQIGPDSTTAGNSTTHQGAKSDMATAPTTQGNHDFIQQQQQQEQQQEQQQQIFPQEGMKTMPVTTAMGDGDSYNASAGFTGTYVMARSSSMEDEQTQITMETFDNRGYPKYRY